MIKFLKRLLKLSIFLIIRIIILVLVFVVASMFYPTNQADLERVNKIEIQLNNPELFKYQKNDKLLDYIKDSKEVNGISLYEYLRITYMNAQWEDKNRRLEKYLSKPKNKELKENLEKKN